MHLKVFLKLKNPTSSLFWVKKNKKTQKKYTQTTHWAGFFLKTRVFSNPAIDPVREQVLQRHLVP
jgi:hypothetical protein